MSNYSILIQGPLNEISLSNIDYYKTLGQVVVSHWEGDDESLLPDDPDVVVLKNPLPETLLYHQDTFDYQIWSILHGLHRVATPFVIRTRSDERWGNLSPLMNAFETNDGAKIVCGNIFFKRWDDFHYHPGDHLFIGMSHVLRKAYQDLVDRHHKYVGEYCAEMSMAHAIMEAAGYEHTKSNFLAAFDVVDINLLGPFVAQFKHAGITYVDEFNEGCAVKSMKEV